jgi:hypothetical protein
MVWRGGLVQRNQLSALWGTTAQGEQNLSEVQERDQVWSGHLSPLW